MKSFLAHIALGMLSSVFSAIFMMCQQKFQSLQLKFIHKKEKLHVRAAATFRRGKFSSAAFLNTSETPGVVWLSSFSQVSQQCSNLCSQHKDIN